jgi:hypothetical protein
MVVAGVDGAGPVSLASAMGTGCVQWAREKPMLNPIIDSSVVAAKERNLVIT